MLCYRGQLTKLGCTVEVASNGLIAVDKMSRVSKSKFDLILLDLEMPVKGNILLSVQCLQVD